MSLEKLREASNGLREAGESIEEREGARMREQADQLSTLTERDQRPDFGRVAHAQQKFKDIKEAEPATGEAGDEANTFLNDYRETVEGV